MSHSIGHNKKVLAISGGVGGAKLALGLSQVLEASQLTIVCNTGDDFVHMGLSISPDLDTVMYTLGGHSNQQQGWGLANESWQVMQQLGKLEGDSWFKLGDRDLATHLYRTQCLSQGSSLSEVTATLATKLGVETCLLPMSDERVQTRVQTAAGALAFQDYFVKQQCQPVAEGFSFVGAEQAKPNSQFMALLSDPQLAAIVICPSNPFVSIDPVLSLPGVRSALKASAAPVVAVSPIVGGEAIKGPTAKMMRELGLDCSVQGVVDHYEGLLDGIVIDNVDSHLEALILTQGVAVKVTHTVMKSVDDKKQLACDALNFSAKLFSESVC